MIQQKTALEKQRRAGIVALVLQGKQGGHGVERTVDDPGCFFEKSIIQPPWPKRKPLLRRLFRGGKNKKSASRFSLIAREKFRSRKSPDANRMWAQPTANWVQAQPASLRYPSPKNSPPDCFYSRISASAAGSFEFLSVQFNKKSDPTGWDHFFWRKERDSNPRCLYRAHTISSRAP